MLWLPVFPAAGVASSAFTGFSVEPPTALAIALDKSPGFPLGAVAVGNAVGAAGSVVGGGKGAVSFVATAATFVPGAAFAGSAVGSESIDKPVEAGCGASAIFC